MSVKCKYIGDDGSRCKNYEKKGTGYCVKHPRSFRIRHFFNKRPWVIVTFKVVAVFSLLVATIDFIYGRYSGSIGIREGREQTKIAKENQQIAEDTQQIAKDTQQTVKDLYKQFKIDSGKLRKRYPHGYVLFTVNPRSSRGTRKAITPYPEDIKWATDVGIDWNSIKLIEITPNTITMTPPNIAGHIYIRLHIRFSRKVGTIKNVIKVKDPSLLVVYEVVYDNGVDDVICLMGLRDDLG